MYTSYERALENFFQEAGGNFFVSPAAEMNKVLKEAPSCDAYLGFINASWNLRAPLKKDIKIDGMEQSVWLSRSFEKAWKSKDTLKIETAICEALGLRPSHTLYDH